MGVILASLGSMFLWLPQCLYWLIANAFMVFDVLQLAFRKLAGLDVYYLNGDKLEKSGDLILQIIQKTFLSGDNNQYPVIATAFWSIVILSAILLVITTVAAVIKNEYSPDKEKKNSKGKIIGNFFKAIASFVVIPLACYFGLFIGNTVLIAIDGITAPESSYNYSFDKNVSGKINGAIEDKCYYDFFGGKVVANFSPLSGIANRAALYSANRVRNSDDFFREVIVNYTDTGSGVTTHFNLFNVNEREVSADIIDTVFLMNAKLKNPQRLDSDMVTETTLVGPFKTPEESVEYFTRYNVGLVSYYYDLWSYNFIVGIFFVIIIMKAMVSFTFGLISRMFTMLALLMVLPLVLGIMPLDGGEGKKGGLKNWGGTFTSKAISAYTQVFTLNLFFMFVPIFQNITFFNGENNLALLDFLVQMIIIGVGLLSISKLDEVIANALHSESSAGEGEKLGKSLASTAGGILNTAGQVGMAAGHVGMAAGRAAFGIAGGVGRAAGALTGAIMNRSHKNKSTGEKIDDKKSKKDKNNNQGSENAKNPNKPNEPMSAQDRTLMDMATERNDSMANKAVSDQESAVNGEYDLKLDNGAQQAYQAYQGDGGQMSYDDYKSKTDVGSYADANQSWNNMDSTEKGKYKDQDDYMNKYYGKNSNNRDGDFSTWQKNGKELLKNDKSLSSGKHQTMGDIQRQIGERNTYVDNRMKDLERQVKAGKAKAGDALGKSAINDYNGRQKIKLDAALQLQGKGYGSEVEATAKMREQRGM